MASLSASFKIGGASPTSLIRSAGSIQRQIATYQDDIARINYENSAKTDADFAVYAKYLSDRAATLNASGNVADATKALTLNQDIVTAQKSNVSSNIQRENIQVMAGNGTLTDKYNTIVGQYQRAISIGDMGLAQSLESQAYSVSQTIQYQAQQAATAQDTLARATAASKGEVVTSLDNALKQLNTDIKNVGQIGADNVTKEWVNKNSGALASMGVIMPKGTIPNYFDIVKGIANAKYNAYTLQAQVQATYDPAAAQNTVAKAQAIQMGTDTIATLGGNMTYQEITQAAQDPNMFAFNYSSGKFEKTQQTGYQYINGQVMPTYSGMVGKAQYDKVFFLNADQTKQMSQLGLNFSQNKNGSTGDGVQFQTTENTPAWLTATLGGKGTANMFTDSAGNLVFKGASADGTGESYYTLSQMGGLSGLFEHMPDGSTRLAGGNYGFDAGAAQLLLNGAQAQQHQVQLNQQVELARQQEQLKLATPQPLPPIKIAPPPTPSPTAPPQSTISTQSIQPAAASIQGSSSAAKAIQPTTSGVNLQGGGSGGIRLQ